MTIDRIEIIDDIMSDIFRQKTPLERLKISFALWRSARYQLYFYLRSMHPDWGEERLNREIAQRISHGAA
jgi:hypothetical protein